MLVLIFKNGELINQKYYLDKFKTVVGRISDCEISLPKSKEISRRHAKIIFNNNGYFLTDLDSANGTMLNGKLLKPSANYPLKANDTIVFAEEIICKLGESKHHVSIPSKMSLSDVGNWEANSLIINPKEILNSFAQPDKPADDSRFSIKDKSKILNILIDVEKQLISLRKIDEYLKLVMSLVFDIIPADRRFLMLINEETGILEMKRYEFGKKHIVDVNQNIPYTRTVVEKVMKEKVGIKTQDAIIDDRFSDSESIFRFGIRSVMCVPLWTKEKILGVIYVDNLAKSSDFSDDEFALLVAFANHAAIGIEQVQLHERYQKERRIRDRLERYHSPEIVERLEQQILKGNEQIEAVLREVTIMFADIVGFTSMIEKMSPGILSKLLNGFYELAANTIFRYQGTLDKFIGDNVMAIFGAPVPMHNAAELAVKSALDLQEALKYFNEKNKDPNQVIKLRIGINTGKAITGDFGSLLRMEYTALGDAVNTASRIESQVARVGQVAVSERTYNLTRDKIKYDYLGEFSVKGKAEKVKAYSAKSVLKEMMIF